jgi:hypothetical protein
MEALRACPRAAYFEQVSGRLLPRNGLMCCHNTSGEESPGYIMELKCYHLSFDGHSCVPVH